MEILNGLSLGLESALQPVTLLYCFIGVFLGTLIGVLPGIGALATISLLLPITYHIPPTAAIVMLAGVYYGAQYGGSTASILLNLPGTPSSAVACLDGYPMAKQGRAGVALFMTTIASFVGSMLGIVALILFSPAIAELGLKFGPAEYFSMMLLGLVAASTVAAGSPVKGLAMVVLGLLLGTVGTDINSGSVRFDFGILELTDGINLVALAMGVFGIAEVTSSINKVRKSNVEEKINFKTMTPTRADVTSSIIPMMRGTSIGSFFGALPGTGASIASFMSMRWRRRWRKTRAVSARVPSRA
jgi:TctA family transporter